MKIYGLLRYYLVSQIKNIETLEQLWDLIYQKEIDVLFMDFSFFEDVKDIRDYFEGVLFFIDDYFHELHCKKALEVGDYYFLYQENVRILYQLHYLKQKIFGNRIFRYKELYFDREQKRLFIARKEQPLSKTERALLYLLTSNKLLSYDELMEEGGVASKESLKVLIFRLRKLGFPIESIKNFGYQLKKE